MVDFGKYDQFNDLLVKAYFDLSGRMGFDDYGVDIWRFPLLWMSFNGWGMKVTDAPHDSAMINSLGNDIALSDAFSKAINDNAAFAATVREFSCRWPIFSNIDIFRRGLESKMYDWYKDKTTEQELLTYVDSPNGIRRGPKSATFDKLNPIWLDTLWAIYIVRCNLLHGNKGDSSGDYEIISGAYRVLRDFIEVADIYRRK